MAGTQCPYLHLYPLVPLPVTRGGLPLPVLLPNCFQHTFLRFPHIFVIFWFLDDDYGILPTAKTIHLLAPMLPLITMSITSRFSMIPLNFLQTCSSVKCTPSPSRAGMACCEDSKANVNDANDAHPNFHIYPVNLRFMLGRRTHDIPFPVLADSHYHDATSITLV